jgi:hypothetical protein
LGFEKPDMSVAVRGSFSKKARSKLSESVAQGLQNLIAGFYSYFGLMPNCWLTRDS